MTTLEIYKTKKEEIIAEVLNQLPNALRGDRVNRTFFVKEDAENEGGIIVDYFVYCGNIVLSDNYFFTIKNTESFDPSDFEVEDFEDIDFEAIGWGKKIEEEIDCKIEVLEEQLEHEKWQEEMAKR